MQIIGKCGRCKRAVVNMRDWRQIPHADRNLKEYTCGPFSRGLCQNCHSFLWQIDAGRRSPGREKLRLTDFERTTVAIADFVEDYLIYSRRTTDRRQIAKLMGMKYATWEKAYYRAKGKGLL